MFKNYIVGIYMVAIVVGAIALVTAPPSAMVSQMEYRSTLQSTRSLSVLPMEVPCEPTTAIPVPLGGLNRWDVPRLPEAFRTNYTGEGLTQYVFNGDQGEVYSYYLPQMATQCWKLIALRGSGATWEKDGQRLWLATAQNPAGGRTYASFATGETKVLGVTYLAADEWMPCGPDGCYTPPPSGTQQPMPGPGATYPSGDSAPMPQPYPTQPYQQYPTPDSNMQQPYPAPQPSPTPMPQPAPGCPQGQFMCNNVCAPDGTPCNGYPYYPPGNTIQAPTTQCNPDNYYCQAMDRCILIGTPCPSTSVQPSQSVCPVGSYWCPLTRGCILTNQVCDAVGQPSPVTQPGPQQVGPGPMGQGDFEQTGQQRMMGPSAEEMQRMDQQRFDGMKKGLSQFSKGVTSMQKMVTRMEKKLGQCGVAIPQELKAALGKAPEIIGKIQAATTPDELEDLVADVQDIGESMQEWGPRFGDLTRICEMMKQATRDEKNLKRSVTRMEGYAKRKTELRELVAELKAVQTTMSQALADAKNLAKTDPEGALDKLEGEFFDRMEEFWGKVGEIDMLYNLTSGLKKAKQEITRFESKAKQLERKKIDTTELRDIIAQIKDKVATVQDLAKRKADPEEIKAEAEGLWDLFTSAQNILDSLGHGAYNPTAKQGENVKIEIPDAFDFGPQGPSMGPPNDMMGPGF